MELDMYGDPAKKCCSRNCEQAAVLKEKNKYYCPDHYAKIILGISLDQIKINKDFSSYEAPKQKI
tara:strand:+ start:329 stop:523 length:195 start_codon:yes stop_codon:yes gene_type:complete